MATVAAKSYLRGHKIVQRDGQWYYSDGERTVGNPRECGHCSRPDAENGHDACVGEIHGAMNACCGHGVSEDAYIQFSSGRIISGEAAISYIKMQSKQATLL